MSRLALFAPLLALLLLAAPGTSSPLATNPLTSSLQCLRAATQRSCHSRYPIAYDSPATCCYNGAIQKGALESGLFLATQFWDTNPPSGKDDRTTVHGLWPDHCDGTYPASCSNITGIPEYTGAQIRAVIAKYDPKLLAYMDENYKGYNGTDEDFWEHEYNKHGTCITTMRTECQPAGPGISQADFAVLNYFRQIINQFKQLPTYDWLAEADIVPSTNKTYSLKAMQDALAQRHGGVPFIGCRKGAFNEVWYYFTVQGQINFGKFFPEQTTTNSTCPEQVKYLPK